MGPEIGPTSPVSAASPLAPRGPAYFTGLNGLRAIAALWVLLTHVAGHTAWFEISARSTGTALLFLMSGFLLYRPHALAHLSAGTAPSVRTFAIRRALRILPAYWVVVLATLALRPDNRDIGTDGMASQFLLLQTYGQGRLLPELFQIWTLCTEVAFYVALPLAAWLLGRGRRSPSRQVVREVVVLVAVVAVAYAYRVGITSHGLVESSSAGLWLPNFAHWFALGMLGALASAWMSLHPGSLQWLRRLSSDEVTCLLVAVCVYGVSATALSGPNNFTSLTISEQVIRVTLAVVAAAFLMLPCAFAEGPRGPVRRALAHPVVDAVGAWAYGIYLWHRLVLYELSDHVDLERGSPLLLTVLLVGTLAVTLPLAALTYYWVEKPAIDLSRRLTRRRRGAVRTSSSTAAAAAPAASATR